MSYNKILDNDIDSIKREILAMIEATKSQYARTFEVIKNQSDELAKKVIADDKKINDLQNSFTNMALWKIAKQQMVAGDLRLAVGAILISREIERIADYAKSICKFFVKYKPEQKALGYVSKMFDLVTQMLNSILTMFENFDVIKPENLFDLEAKLNMSFNELNNEIISVAESNSEFKSVENLFMTLRQLKNLERAGDHIVSVEEVLRFIKTGKFEDIELADQNVQVDKIKNEN
ncbi:phosphate signaling complex protein PhoU [Spiroplasma endosymbiont of Labia minor]|uniref:phosphate signaling complex protein PhoU n=1 Tax=Spiroplasma endosymbiont of Labia minor TaxID=3066305 RepID=UPI0030CDA47C